MFVNDISDGLFTGFTLRPFAVGWLCRTLNLSEYSSTKASGKVTASLLSAQQIVQCKTNVKLLLNCAQILSTQCAFGALLAEWLNV